MSLLATDAIVLHAFSYLETSRILRLLTRDAGVQSVLARGARNSRKRFGSALDLFAEGTAELQLKPGRDLHTLTSFDVTKSRPGLGDVEGSKGVQIAPWLELQLGGALGKQVERTAEAFARVTRSPRQHRLHPRIARQ